MVRFGKYSPNNPEYLGTGCGVLGLGEYEEKRRYYDEQRRLEYKEYFTQQALKMSAKSKADKAKVNIIDEKENFMENRRRNDSLQKHAATQTECRCKDVSTNTEAEIIKAERVKQSHILKNDSDKIYSTNSCLIPKNVTNYDINNKNGLSWFGGELEPSRDSSPKSSPRLVKHGVLSDFLNQDSEDRASSLAKTKTARRVWRNNASSYEKELRAQIEERQRLKAELEAKERLEELERNQWVIKEEERALSRQKEEDEKARTRDYHRKKRMNEFFHREEELKKEGEERRDAEVRQRILDSQSHTPGTDADREKHFSEERYISQPVPGQTNPPLKNPLIPVQESDMFRNLSSSPVKSSRRRSSGAQVGEASQLEDKWCLTPVKRIDGKQAHSNAPLSTRDHQSANARRNLSKPVSARVPNTSLPANMKFTQSTSLTNNLGKDEGAIQRTEEKLSCDHSIFANLGEIRRKLKMEQMRMEEAIKNQNIDLSSKTGSINN